MEQQKALAAALGHQTAVAAGCPKLDVEGAAPKFGGLPEFDETQIPELAPLSEMEGKYSYLMISLSFTLYKEREVLIFINFISSPSSTEVGSL